MDELPLFRTITVKPLERPISRHDGLEVYYLYQLYLLSLNGSEVNDFIELTRLVVDKAINHLDFDRVGVLLFEPHTQSIKGTWGTDSQGKLTNEQHMSSPVADKLSPILNAVQEKGQIVVWENTPIVDFELQGGVKIIGDGWNSAYGFWFEGELIGWIAADNVLSQQAFSPIHQQLFRMLGDLLGEHYRRIRNHQRIQELNDKLANINQKLEREATHDHLTGLPNRRFFYDFFSRIRSIAQREHKRFALVLLDLDYFKALNDNYGHQRGDQALQSLAQIFASSMRESDFVARMGGEEFAFIVQADHGQQLKVFCQRIKQRIEAELFVVLQLQKPITASIGAYLPKQLQDIDSMMRQADLCLYQAKDAGRNTIVIIDEAQPAPEPESILQPD